MRKNNAVFCRMLSALLMICMLIGMLPIVGAADKTVESTLDFLQMAGQIDGYEAGGSQQVTIEPTGMRVMLNQEWDTTQGSFTCPWETAGNHESAAHYVTIPVNKTININDSPYLHMTVQGDSTNSERAAWAFTFFFQYTDENGETESSYCWLKGLSFEGADPSDSEQYFKDSYQDVKSTVITDWLKENGYHNADGTVTVTGVMVKVRGRVNDSFTFSTLAMGPEKLDAPHAETPVISPNGGSVSTNRDITITSRTPGAAIYYTVDGTDPTAESIKYEAPFRLTEACTIKAIAIADGMDNSAIASADFTIKTEADPEPFAFDFTECMSADPQHLIDPRHATLETHGWAVNADETDPWDDDPSNPDKIFEMRSTGLYTFTPWIDRGDPTKFKTLTLDFDVQTAGFYRIDAISVYENGNAGELAIALDGKEVKGYRAYIATESYWGKELTDPQKLGYSYLEEGKHKIAFTVTYGSIIHLNKLVFTPINVEEADADQLIVSAGNLFPVNEGKSGNASLRATFADLPMSLRGMEITATSEDDKIATASITTEAVSGEPQITVTGVSGGKTNIQVIVKVGEVEKKLDIPVSVINAAAAFALDFKACMASNPQHSTDPGHATLETHGWAVNTTETQSFEKSFEMESEGLLASQWWISAGQTENYKTLTLDFNVAMDGFYKISAITAQNQDTGWFETTVDGKPIQKIKSTIAGQSEYTLSDEEDIGYAYLTAGTHKIAFTLIYASGIYLNKIQFTPVELIKGQAEVSATEIDAIDVGETVESMISAKIGEVPVALSASNIEITVADPDIAVASVEDSAGSAVVKITGSKAGDTEVFVSANFGETSETIGIPISVNANDGGARTFSLDFTACNRKGHDNDITHATLEEHNWSFNAAQSSNTAQFKYFTMTQGGLHAHSDTWWSSEADSRTVAIDFNVPVTGTYSVDIQSIMSQDGGNVVAKIDGQNLGQYDAYQAIAETEFIVGPKNCLGYAYLTEGTHTITLTNIQRYDIYPNLIKFTPVTIDESKLALQIAELEALPAGNDISSQINSNYDGKNYANLSFASIEAISENPEIATVSVVSDEQTGTRTLNIHGVQQGTAKITITGVTTDGITIKSENTIHVLSDLAHTHVIDFTKCAAEGHSSDITHATLETCGWSYDAEKSQAASANKVLEVNEEGVLATSNTTASSSNTYNLVLNFMVPEGGYYSIDYVGAAPANNSWSRVIIDGTHMVGNYGGGQWTVGQSYLDKGAHTIQVQITTGTSVALSKLVLNELIVLPGEMLIKTGALRAINEGMSENVAIMVSSASGTPIQSNKVDIRAVPRDESIAKTQIGLTVGGEEKELTVTGLKEGSTIVDVSLYMCNRLVSTWELPITVRKSVFDSVEVSAEDGRMLGLSSDGTQLEVVAYDPDGLKISMAQAQINFSSSNPEVLTVSESGYVTPHAIGTATVTVNVTIGGITKSASIEISIKDKKTASTIYTPEMIEAARENVKLYPWARSSADAVIKTAEQYVGKEEQIWNLITTQELPRSITVGWRLDPEAYTCRYCGTDLRAEYGLYSWLLDPLNDPWKIQCPDCRRKFPSNDFGKFYESGIDENGFWSYELAKENGQEYLKNILYPEKGEGWGVDDGWGYLTGDTWTDGSRSGPEAHSYIAYYNHWGIWHASAMPQTAVDYCSLAYLYTGDIRYGRVAAIVTDRMADVWPSMYVEPYNPAFFPNWKRGKAVDMTWECGTSQNMVRSYDKVYDVYDDPYVVSFLSEKAAKYNMENPKTSPELIRDNCETGILREVFKAAQEGNINGNFGMHQASVIDAAVALDSMPETKEMIDWAFQTGTEVSDGPVYGGNITKKLIDDVSRDGLGNESAPHYNNLWIGQIKTFADVLANYPGYEEVNLYKNPQYIKMIKGIFPMTLSRTYTPDIADSGMTASTQIQATLTNVVSAYVNTGDPEFAQFAYFLNGNTVDGINTGIFTKNPTAIQQQIQNVIDTYGEWDGFDKSTQMAGYGFTALKGGSYYPAEQEVNSVNTQRNFWMYYGIGVGHGGKHGHGDALTLGLDAFGLNMAPDLGYPEACDGSDKYNNQVLSTITHNTVEVNAARQSGMSTNGEPMHYDGDGRVKLMDVDAPQANGSGVTSIFRRTVVMVDVSDEVSYGVDFFRVKGGNEHVYSFHSLSDTIYETETLDLVGQVNAAGEYIGSYAGPDVPYATAGSVSGYSWIKNIRQDTSVEDNTFAVDFKVMDQFRNILPSAQDLHLRLTMLPSTTLTDVALGTVIPPQRDNNPQSLEYVLARRKGNSLDSMFTSVLEPYKDERYIKSLELVPVTKADGSPVSDSADIVRAVKVTLTSGRVDYIVYASNNSIEYRVDDVFNFKGFVGVYTLDGDSPSYYYMNDGTKIGELEGEDAYTGTVTDFTKELIMENSITVRFDQDVDVDRLANTFIYIENDGTQNAAYPVESAVRNSDGTVTLDIGDKTPIRSSRTVVGIEATYNYNITEGQSFRLPLATEIDHTPVFHPIGKKNGEVGSELRFNVSAESPAGKELTYSEKDLPRGAQFDETTQTFTWIPDSGQIGKNVAAFEVTDGTLSATQYVEITVYNSASSGGSGSINKPHPGTGGGSGSSSGDGEGDGDDEIITQPEPVVEKDEVTFAASPAETTAESKLGSVTFPDGTFAEDGQGTLTIEREDDAFAISVTADVEQNETLAKVSLNYTPESNMTDENCIIVKDGNGNIIPSGRYADGKVTFYTETFGDFTIEYNAKSFTDLGNHAWAKDAITRLAARGIINGITASTYGPGNNITRADFTTLIVRAFGFESEVASFADVPANAYYAEPVGIAKTLGIVGGVNATDFAPTAEITRQDMMVIIARALDVAGYTLESNTNATFADFAQVADYAKDAVKALTGAGLIVGSNGSINPLGKTTRAEVAVLLDRIVFMSK